MDISSILSSDSTQSIDPTEVFKKWTDKKLHADSGDTVTISDEGRKKADELVQAQKTSQASPSGMEEEDA